MKRYLAFILAATLLTSFIWAEKFVFRYAKGDKYRFLTTVNEDVYVNHKLGKQAIILNRIAFEVVDASADGAWGFLSGSFETSEQGKAGEAYVISESYDSEFKRDRLGHYTIDPKYFMPVVRDVPVFPDRDLSPGDTWNAPGQERHDMRPVFGIPDPYRIDFEARYRYEGPVQRNGKDLRLFSVSYTIFTRPPVPSSWKRAYPVQIAGYSEEKIWWDPAIGQPVAYEERFDFVFDWSDGSNYEYRGRSGSEMLKAELMDKDGLAADLKKAVEGMPNVSVAKSEEGVTISLEDIQFMPDSAVLMPSEDAKLAKIAEILKRYPDRDILVAGHAAAAGWAGGRKQLSEDRARAVAERLIQLGARLPERIRAIGWGDEKPIADNSTEAGRAKNRRVEITILEN